MSYLGAAITRERKAAGVTSKHLAERTNLSQQYIGDLQRGRRNPTPETLLLICDVLPAADRAQWLWLLLRDLWGNEIAEMLRRHIRARLAEADEPVSAG